MNQLLGPAKFLLSDEARRIDLGGFLKLGQGLLELTGFAEQLSAMHVRGGSQEAGPLIGRAEGQITGFLLVGLFVKIEGGFVVLASFRVFAFVIQRLGAFGCADRQGHRHHEQRNCCRANQACLQWIPRRQSSLGIGQ